MWFSLEALIAHSIQSGVKVRRIMTSGSLIANLRNQVAVSALEKEATHLLFIDADMVFDKDALLQLLKHDRDIVSGLAVSRKPPFNPVAKDLQEDGSYVIREGLDEGRFYSDLDMIGTAFMLIKMDVFRKLEKPYFSMPPYGEGNMGEDVYFCRKAKEAGYDVCLDSSLLVGHIGERIYTIHDYNDFKESIAEDA